MSRIYYRNAFPRIKQLLKDFPVVQLTGASQIGKTAFVKRYFPDYQYVSLKQEQLKILLKKDPYRFFKLYSGKTIIDDTDEIPEFSLLLFEYSVSVYQPGSYLLVSSVRSAIHEQLAELKLFPFSISEFKQEQLFSFELEESIIRGGYPKNTATFYEKMLKISLTGNFPRLLAVHDAALPLCLLQNCVPFIDQPLNINLLSKELGLTQPTVAAWLEVFEKLGLIYFLRSFEQDFSKRRIKSPKLYFTDTGLACFLLKIKTKDQLIRSLFFSSLVNNFYLMEFLKRGALEAKKREFYYWKESNGHEIQLLIQNPTSVDAYAFGSSHEFQQVASKELELFDEISDGIVLSKTLVFGGYKNQEKRNIHLLSWQLIT